MTGQSYHASYGERRAGLCRTTKSVVSVTKLVYLIVPNSQYNPKRVFTTGSLGMHGFFAVEANASFEPEPIIRGVM